MAGIRNYEELSIIGKGAYGTVFKAIDRDNNRTVALKRVRIINSNEEKGVPVSTLREITLLKQLDNMAHPNIVRMFDAFQTFSTTPTDSPSDLILTIVFEHVDQDLSQFLRSCPSPGLPEELIKDLMHQLLSGLDYLHVNRMVHRDIKPQNVLITKNKQVKIADFGLARVYGFCKLVTSVVVTLWYRAPEILLQVPYATLVDLWSVGTIMAEMYNRRPLFPGKSEIDQLHKILSVIGSPDKHEWPEKATLKWEQFNKLQRIDLRHLVTEMCPEGLDLIKSLLMFDPERRPSAKSCLDHPYFSGLDYQDSQDSGVSLPVHHSKKIKYEQQKRNKVQATKPLSSSSTSTSSATTTTNFLNPHRSSDSNRPTSSKQIDNSTTGQSKQHQQASKHYSRDQTTLDNQSTLQREVDQKANVNISSCEKLTDEKHDCINAVPADIKLEGELNRSDSGLGDSFPDALSATTTNNLRSFSRADSGICVSPQNVYSDDQESSNSSSTFEPKDFDC